MVIKMFRNRTSAIFCCLFPTSSFHMLPHSGGMFWFLFQSCEAIEA